MIFTSETICTNKVEAKSPDPAVLTLLFSSSSVLLSPADVCVTQSSVHVCVLDANTCVHFCLSPEA